MKQKVGRHESISVFLKFISTHRELQDEAKNLYNKDLHTRNFGRVISTLAFKCKSCIIRALIFVYHSKIKKQNFQITSNEKHCADFPRFFVAQ